MIHRNSTTITFVFVFAGNELSGNGVGVRVAADQYAYDTITLRNKVEDIYKDVEEKPIVLAPGGFFDTNWFQTFITKAKNSVDVVTHHIYNLGPGNNHNLTRKISSFFFKSHQEI